MPIAESLPTFLSRWLPLTGAPAAIVYVPPIDVIGWFGYRAAYRDYSGSLHLGLLLLFWCFAGCAQWWVLRRRIARAGSWGFMTFVGGLVAIVAYLAGARLILPIWSSLLGVAPRPVGIALFPGGVGTVHQTLFFAVQGAMFGLTLATLQSFVAPVRWRDRIQWVSLSAGAAGLAFAVVWIIHAIFFDAMSDRYFGVPSRIVGVTSFVSPLGWIIYVLATGIGLHRILVRKQHAHERSLTARFD